MLFLQWQWSVGTLAAGNELDQIWAILALPEAATYTHLHLIATSRVVGSDVTVVIGHRPACLFKASSGDILASSLAAVHIHVHLSLAK